MRWAWAFVLVGAAATGRGVGSLARSTPSSEHSSLATPTLTLTTPLSNGYESALVGLGVGNLRHEDIPNTVTAAVARHGVRLIDTAIASRNGAIVSRAVGRKLSCRVVRYLPLESFFFPRVSIGDFVLEKSPSNFTISTP